MKTLPSKELYIEVMNIKNEFERFTDYFEKGVIDSFYEKDNTIYMTIFHQSKQDVKGRGTFVPFNINIYELAHKCKEWALSKNYEIESSLFIDGNKKRIGYSQVLREEAPMHQRTADTETEAIFKACEWIMERTK